MVLILEKEGNKRCALEANNIEPFTQKTFKELINECHLRKRDYYIARVKCTGKPNDTINNIANSTESTQAKSNPETSVLYFCYDARQLCKYVFEMLISADGRKIRIKNFTDPIHQRDISELNFFRLRYESETPLRAEYVGNHLDFLESNCFRSKVFYKEDPLDALSVNFDFQKMKNITVLSKKQIISLFITIIFILIICTLLVMNMEKKSIARPTMSLASKLYIT
ncbi:hypothetical protein TCON_2320 [Astathelohania contejeani]|uniref:Uncharacterized protein n=1 Tax=Astathelohania contejeani TaxID=164912 RepID=A0ABQ7HWC1_9MICR|nr:hypothetical protein TCON_2320 [Thelohania contejeani]